MSAACCSSSGLPGGGGGGGFHRRLGNDKNQPETYLKGVGAGTTRSPSMPANMAHTSLAGFGAEVEADKADEADDDEASGDGATAGRRRRRKRLRKAKASLATRDHRAACSVLGMPASFLKRGSSAAAIMCPFCRPTCRFRGPRCLCSFTTVPATPRPRAPLGLELDLDRNGRGHHRVLELTVGVVHHRIYLGPNRGSRRARQKW